MDTALQRKIEQLVSDLAASHFDAIAADGRSGRLSADDLRGVVTKYGRTLISLPSEVWPTVDEYPQAANPNEIALDIPLWTKEEGRSDLTLSINARRTGADW